MIIVWGCISNYSQETLDLGVSCSLGQFPSPLKTLGPRSQEGLMIQDSSHVGPAVLGRAWCGRGGAQPFLLTLSLLQECCGFNELRSLDERIRSENKG